MNHPVLYSFRRCPYAMRARLALYQSGKTAELREIKLRNKPEEMLATSPKGTVPVLILPDGTVIDESLDVMMWALAQNDPDDWLNDDSETRDHLINHNDNEFKKALDRYKYPSRYPDEDCSNARDICEKTFRDLNDRLANHRYLCGDHITLSDMAIFPFIRQCAAVDRDWFGSLDMPYLQAWLEEHLNSALFKAIMAKYDEWAPDSAPIYFGHP